jgi:hypothetical protein
MLEGYATEQHRLPAPTRCDNCNSPKIRLIEAEGRSGKVWHCDRCKASVGCHNGTISPFGLMATGKVRRLRVEVHRVFDPLWKNAGLSRDEAYFWLQTTLGISAEACHISMLSEKQLIVAFQAAKQYQYKLGDIEHRRRKKSHEQQRKLGERQFRRQRGRKNG